jgi:hypothetical protein
MEQGEDVLARKYWRLDKLIEAAKSEVDPSLSSEMLKRLKKKDCRQYLTELRNILNDHDRPPRIRRAAAIAVARAGTPAGLKALREALSIPHPLIRRTVLGSLGRLGNRHTLAWLDEWRETRDMHRTLQWARALIAYRHGLPGHELRAPRSAVEMGVRADEAERIVVRQASHRDTARITKELSEDVPGGISLAGTDALRLACGPRRYIYLWNNAVLGDDLAERLQQKKALAGVLAELFAEKSSPGTWAVKYMILTHPRRRPAGFVILGTTRGGTVTYRGSAIVEADAVSLSLSAVSVPGAVPLEISGTVRGSRIAVESAVSGVLRRGKLVPRVVKSQRI